MEHNPDDGKPFETKLTQRFAQCQNQQQQAARLTVAIEAHLKNLGFIGA